MKYEKLQKPILMILVSIFIFIMSNSVITNGHDVIYDAKADTSYIINQTKIRDSELTYSWLYHSIYVDKNIDAEDVRWSLSEIGIEYVYIQGDMIDNSYYNVDIVENYGYVYSLK